MINHDNLADYRDTVIYDLENEDHAPTQEFYIALAKQCNGSVLELGCGTGRFTLPIAAAGIPITGLDITPEMLARAQEKAAALGLMVDWVEADVRNFALGKQFGLIFESGATFQHLLTREDQEMALTYIRAHLEEDGIFAISIHHFRPENLKDELEEQAWYSYDHPDGYEVRVSGTQTYDVLRQVKHETAVRRWTTTSGEEVVRHAPLAQRCIFPQEMAALLHYNGFAIENIYGDSSFTPPTASSYSITYLCKKR